MDKEKLNRLAMIVGTAVRQPGWNAWTTKQKVEFEAKLDKFTTEELELLHRKWLEETK